MPYCEVEPDVKLYYEDFGEGKPLLFIHGGAMSHEMWEQQVYELADHFRVVCPDLRGHGESDKPRHGHNFERLVQDIDALAEKLQLRDLTVISHGIGGYVGILYTLARKDRVARLALVSSGARFVGADEERGGFSNELWERYTRGMGENKIQASADLIDETFFYRDPGPATRQAILNINLQWPVYAMKMLGRDLAGIDLEHRLKEIDVPTLVVHGRHDRKQRFAGAEHLAKCIPGARLVAFDESAHNPQFEEREKFNRLIREFAST
jgi:pimeloyl-ACP methyl ester carboxylesterase